ncbi:hypothetical protein VNO80_26782 [Phaseolus coccineus]|uniref:Peroxidase n=1 Tax=Phaseolus coccineus TaxID=3886 RepID=A0AAN9QH03_PHACN
MRSCFILWIVVALVVPVLLSLRRPRGETRTTSSASLSDSSSFSVKLANSFHFNKRIRDGSNLEYDFYRNTCPQAEGIVRSALTRIYFDHRDVAPALLRLFFHDCFIQLFLIPSAKLRGSCTLGFAQYAVDKSGALGRLGTLYENDGNSNRSVEKQAVPNQTLRGFDKIDLIKEEVEQACPGVVSCADIVSLAARDSVLLAGGPFYPVLTGRRDNHQSFFKEATDQIPRPDDNVTRTLHLFNLRGFNARETNTRQPDPSIPLDFLRQMRLNCPNNSSTNNNKDEFVTSKYMTNDVHPKPGMSYMQALSSSVSSGSTFDTHYFQSLLRGRGLLFADQQLMVEDKTAKLVSAYASDDGSTFRMDFAKVMLKMSNLDVLTGPQGQVRLNCSKPVTS